MGDDSQPIESFTDMSAKCVETWLLLRIKSSPLHLLSSPLSTTPNYDKVFKDALLEGNRRCEVVAIDDSLESLLKSSITNIKEDASNQT